VIIEDGETTVVRETSVDSCEPVDSLSVNLVTRRVVDSSVLTARLCSHNERYYHAKYCVRNYSGPSFPRHVNYLVAVAT